LRGGAPHFFNSQNIQKYIFLFFIFLNPGFFKSSWKFLGKFLEICSFIVHFSHCWLFDEYYIHGFMV